MASANVDLVRSIYADWERGDFTSVGWAHPEVEFVIVGGPSPGTWTGLAGMAAAGRDLLTPWADFRVHAEQYRELDDERVLVLLDNSGRGRTSGIDLEQVRGGAFLHHVREGKVTRLVNYWDRARAFADLGLSE
jgi:ketosteroid isomerase-like protein